jgi:hypothetical protein
LYFVKDSSTTEHCVSKKELCGLYAERNEMSEMLSVKCKIAEKIGCSIFKMKTNTV